MNENNVQEKETTEVVTSVGDAWVKTRSKKSGRIYYFNTLTGNAVWNLSEADIKKATQNVNSDRKMPEPPPEKTESMTQIKLDNIVITKTVNNTNPRIPVDPYNHPSSSFNNIPGMYPPSMYWGYPPQHPALLNMPLPEHPLIHVHFTSVPISNRFKMIEQKSTEENLPAPSKVNFDTIRPCRSTNTPKKIYDLRQVLKAKEKLRSENVYQSSEIGTTDDSVMPDTLSRLEVSNETNTTYDIEKYPYENETYLSSTEPQNDIEMRQETSEEVIEMQTIPNNLSNNEEFPDITHEGNNNMDETEGENEISDEKWLADNMRMHENKSILDLTSLRNLCDYEGIDYWYILPDTNVLFRHLNFLNILVNSDEKCRLLIARRVYEEVLSTAKRVTERNIHIHARYACRFLDQLISSKQAIRDNHLMSGSEHVGYYDGDDEILDSCSRLVHLKHRFIIITDDKLLYQKLKTLNVHSFKVHQLKNFLAFYQGRSDVPKSKEPIKITINNGLFENHSINGVATWPSCKTYPNNQASQFIPDSQYQNVQYVFNSQENHFHEQNKTDICQQLEVSSTRFETVQCIITDSQDNVRNKPDFGQVKVSKKKFDRIQFSTDSQEEQLIANRKPDVNNRTEKNINEIEKTNNNVRKAGTCTLQLNDKTPKECNLSSKSNQSSSTNYNPTKTTVKKIRLNRNTPLKQSDAPTSSHKQKVFRWRRRTVTNSETSLKNTSETAGLTDAANSDISKTKTEETPTKEKCDSDESVKHNSTLQYRTSVEESSNTGSDVISNTRSSVLSDRASNCGNYKKLVNNNNSIERRNNDGSEKFQVTDSAMEEMLRMGMEEWVSRFLQIMEEALNLVLQNHKDLLETSMRAPWTVREATECIAKCFKKYRRVQTAAGYLSNTLTSLSDCKGNIRYNMSPSQFMQMFAHGVYLINILQIDVENSDDIQTSKQMLSGLLEDIKHPQSYSTSIESNYDNSVKDLGLEKEEKKESHKFPIPSTTSKELLPQKNNLDEQKNTESQAIQAETVTFKRIFNNISLESLKKLSLQKKMIAAAKKETNVIAKEDFNNKSQNSENKSPLNGVVDVNIDNKHFEPKVIMKFNKCLDFEERLKRNNRLHEDIVDDFDDDESDFNTNETDSQIDQQDACDGAVDHFMNEKRCDQANDNKCAEENDEDFNEHDEIDQNDSYDDEDDYEMKIASNTTIEIVVKSFLKSIKETLLRAQDFCVQAQSEFCNSENVSVNRRMELQEEARQQQRNITNLQDTMKIILDREKNKDSNIYITNLRSHIPKSHLSSYGDIIGQVAVQSKILLKALDFVNLILTD